MGVCAYDDRPCTLSDTSAELRTPASILGEHIEHVCTTILDMSDDAFVGLLADGVFEQHD